jgi:tetrahydromethanopterin S-methyltransferase subunit G
VKEGKYTKAIAMPERGDAVIVIYDVVKWREDFKEIKEFLDKFPSIDFVLSVEFDNVGKRILDDVYRICTELQH